MPSVIRGGGLSQVSADIELYIKRITRLKSFETVFEFYTVEPFFPRGFNFREFRESTSISRKFVPREIFIERK